jgi:glucitol operon activator protein
MPTIEQIGALALVLWLVQLALSYRQARFFTRRIGELRKLGLCATGLAGGAYRGRAYVALVAHPHTHRIIKAELLQGLTVFAQLKPVTSLEGYSIDDLLSDQLPAVNGMSPKVIAAARSAAEAIQKAQAKAPTGS